MSGPTQTVYLSNPTVLANAVTNMDSILNDLGYGQTLNPTLSTLIQPQLQDFAYGAAGECPHAGGFIYAGNVKSGQSFFASTGSFTSTGTQATLDTIYAGGSSGKIIIGTIVAKMMEEGLFDETTKLSSIDPVLFSGNAQYYTSITPVTGAEGLFPAPGTYLATTGSYNIANYTISDAIRMNIGAFIDGFNMPCLLGLLATTFSTGSTSLLGNLGSNATLSDKGYCVNVYNYWTSMFTQGTGCIGYFGQIVNGKPYNSNITYELIDSLFTLAKNGTIPLLYAPGSLEIGRLPWALRSLPATYDTGYAILGYIVDKVARQNGYTNLKDYANQKFFNTLGMTNTYFFPQDVPSADLIADSSFRRGVAVSAVPFTLTGSQKPFNVMDPTTWNSYGCSPAYATGAYAQFNPANPLTYKNPLVWSRDPTYADDGISRLSPLFNGTLTSSSTGYVLGDAPTYMSIRDFGTWLQFLANRGVAPNGTRLLKTETFNYITATKIAPISAETANLTLLDAESDNSQSKEFCMGVAKTSKDFSNRTVYGFDDTTFYWSGASGNFYMFDIYTGNWLYYGVPENFLSSGTIDLPASATYPIPPTYLGRSFGAGDIGTKYFQNFLSKMIRS
jgi:CubicO group peptidase (beta-lactamase class C family)